MRFMLCRTMRRHMKLHGMLEGECVGSYGSGGYDPHIADPSEARALSSTLWELPMLLNHFQPAVAQCAAAAAAIGSDAAAATLEGTLHALEPHALASRYAYRHAGLLCEVAGKAAGRQNGTAAGKRGGAPGNSPVVTALAAHCAGVADVRQECGLGGAAEADLAGSELAGMFRCGAVTPVTGCGSSYVISPLVCSHWAGMDMYHRVSHGCPVVVACARLSLM